MKLKKISIVIIVVMLITVSLLMAVVYSYATVPKISALESQVAIDDVGNNYVVHNGEIQNEIYKLDKDGKVISIYSSISADDTVKSYITEIIHYKGTLYAVRQSIDENTNSTVRQEIITFENEEKLTRPKVLYTYQSVGMPPITSITAQDDMLYVSAVKSSGEKAFVDAIPLQAPYKISESMEFSAQFNNGFHYGTYHNGRLYAVTKSGEVLEYYGNSMKNILSAEEKDYGRITKLSVIKNGIRFSDDLSGDEFFFGDDSKITRKAMPADKRIITWAEEGTNSLCIIENDDLECTFEINSAQGKNVISEINMPLSIHILRCGTAAIILFLILFAIFLIIIVSIHLAKRQKRIIAKFIIIIMPVMLLAFAGFGIAQYVAIQKNLINTRFIMTEEFNNSTKKAIDIDELQKLDNPQEYKTYNYRVLQNTLRTQNSQRISNGEKDEFNGMVIKNEVMVLKNDELYTGISLDLPCFYHASSVFSPDFVRLMQQSLTDNKVVTQKVFDRYGKWITSASPVTSLGGKNVGVMLTMISTADINIYLENYLHNYLLTMLLLILIMLIPITVSFISILRPVRLLENGMERVMNGKLDTVIDNNSRDEFQGITIGFNKMCTDLSLKIYQINNISNSYYRFMPRSVFKLLKKESILDVNEGDLKSLNCSFLVMSLHNLSQLRSLMDNMEFMAYIGKITDYINEEIQCENGVLMASDMDLSKLKIIFPDSVFDAAQFTSKAKEYFHSTQMQVNGISPEVTFILHYTDMLYGITGKNDLIFPFLVSSEVDFITQIVSRFGQSGVSSVMTGEFMDKIDKLEKSQEKYPKRYIGYMMQDKTKRYELYQILPTGAFDSQHLSQEKTFAKGLELFYNGDFYNARNLFSLALKNMPNSGIARWYVLAADKYYQYPDQYINHELFGTDTHLT